MTYSIDVQNIGKRYYIGERVEQSSLIVEVLDMIRAPLRRIRDVARGDIYAATAHQRSIWALKNVSFTVNQGEVIGIIGHNGAGKSTLLKVLTRITKPTEGQAILDGRVGALLEVGTGFHGELSGRENVYLNGAVLGMSRRETEKKFDQIVEFSGVERFLETPVKRYSSGMRMRLAFSVAAHLEPEILLIDEVLAVGDAAFQKKSLGKMNAVATEGRTVLFVSHDISAIQSLCKRVIVMSHGNIVFDGDVTEAIRLYLNQKDGSDDESSAVQQFDLAPDEETGFQPLSLRIVDDNNTLRENFTSAENVNIDVDFIMPQLQANFRIGVEVRNSAGTLLFESMHNDTSDILRAHVEGRRRAQVTIPRYFLNSDEYFVGLVAKLHRVRPLVQDSLPRVQFNILYDAPNPDITYTKHERPGLLAPALEWREIALNPDANYTTTEA